MVDQVTFRTTDNTRWGAGQGSDLSATQIDINFWVLLTAVQALQTSTAEVASIDHFVILTNQLFVHLTNHVVLGPYTLPSAQWTFRGPWAPLTEYQFFDVFTNNRTIYLVLFPHRSNALFSPFASDNVGHNYYGVLLAAAPSELPQNGTLGQYLQWQTSPLDVRWNTLTRNIALYLETPPSPIENVMDYMFTELTTFPQGLVGSQFSVGTRPTGDQEYDLFQDGGPIGSVIFHHTGAPTVTFHHPIDFQIGDILSVVGPSVPDMHMTRIRMTFLGDLP